MGFHHIWKIYVCESAMNSSDSSGNDKKGLTRRRFLETTIGSAMVSTILPRVWAAEVKNGVPYRTLGNTGEKVSCIGLGGAHIGNTKLNDDESIRLIRTAIDEGINFMDNCWDYNGGNSEIRMGNALRDGYRQKVFLMTKIDSQTKAGAAKQIDECLKRLQTDHLDLLQLHEVIRPTDPERIFAAGGSMEALVDARQKGKLRYIGFTGHKSPEIHLAMIETARAHKFKLNSVQMPLNIMDAHYDSFGKKVLPVLVKENIGALGMKPLGGGVLLKSNAVDAEDCLRYALNLPASVVITGCDSMEVLQQALRVARNFKPLSDAELAGLLAKTSDAAQKGEFELYKSSNHFDGTIRNPQWLD
jgi:aryl-alcohol dehydrogenase-like predicted oxidoreductase